MTEPTDALTRRGLLNRALQAASLTTLLDPTPGAEAQDQSAPRIRESFDAEWKFFKGEAPGADAVSFNDSHWRTLTLPHDWSIEGPFSRSEPSGGAGGYAPTGIGWYRKHFTVPAFYRDRKVSLEFDGVYQNSEVWLNGHYLGKRPYGFITFAYDITPYLNFGAPNVVAVKVDNEPQPSCRWYSGSGIYRHTWLTAVHPIHVALWGTFVTTPRITNESATVHARTLVRNASPVAANSTLTTAILDANGNTVHSTESTQSIPAGNAYEFSQELTVTQPQRWGLSTPTLYTLRSTVRAAGVLTDVYDTPFGIREATFDANRGFFLNGEHVKINGVCLHHEAGSVGAAVPLRVWQRRFELLRAMGCNAIRTSHNPPAPEFLDLCDRMGFLVMDEPFDEWKSGKGQVHGNGYSRLWDEWHVRDATDFLRRDRNHPSIVLWSCGNEIPDQLSPQGPEILRELLSLFHNLDPTRPVTAACDQIAAQPKRAPVEFLDLLDIVGYNYADRWRNRRELYYSIDKLAHPNWRMIGTESSGMGGPRGDYSGLLPPAPGETPPSAPTRPGFYFGSRAGRALDTENLWRFVRTHDYVSGDFMWTGIDYLGEAFGNSRGATAGVIDTCGFPKDGYYFYQSQWVSQPVLHLFPHWNWKGREGQCLPVSCYTNCESVELFLNGKSIGVKGYSFPRYGMEERYGHYDPARINPNRTTSDLHLSWDVPYEPGTLKAVGKKQGKVVAETEVSTTGDPAAVILSPDRNAIRADGRDVVHIAIQIADAQGRVNPLADNTVTLDVRGPGRLIGVDNGNVADMTFDFKANHIQAYHGLCLAIVQSSGTGRIEINATSPGLKSSSAVITAHA